MRFKPFFQIQNTPLDPQVSFLLLPFSLARAAVCPLVTFAQQLMLLTLSFMRNVPPNTGKQSGQWLTVLPGLSQGPFTTSLVAQTGKNPPVVQETRVPSLGWKMPWRREWQPIPAFLPGESHAQRSLVGYRAWGCKVGHDWVTNTLLSWGDRTLVPWLFEVPPLTDPAQAWVWNWTGPWRVGFEASAAISGERRLPSRWVVNGRRYARVSAEHFCHHKGVVCLRK